MPADRRHRGKHPGDEALFARATQPILAAATAELSWLLGKGYNDTAALKLVGDRHALTKRQRQAVSRCACGAETLAARRAREVPVDQLADRPLALDGFNCLITLETALSGGLILVGAEGCVRDLSSIHGTYRSVCETPRAIDLVGEALAAAGAGGVTWYLDRPVSNSGRLRALIEGVAAARRWPWTVTLQNNPDRELAASAAVVATSDSWILDRCAAWTNLVGTIVERRLPATWRLALRPPEGRS